MPLLFRHIKTAWKAFLNSLVFGRFLKTTFSHIFPFYENYLQKTMLVSLEIFTSYSRLCHLCNKVVFSMLN